MGRRALTKNRPAARPVGPPEDLRPVAAPVGRRRAVRSPRRWRSRSARARGCSSARPPRRSPDVNFLGIEIAQKYAQFAAAGLAKRGLTNAVMVVRRRAADLRRTAARGSARGGPRLFSRPLVEEAPPQTPRDERGVSARRRADAASPAGGCTSGPTSRSTFTSTLELIAATTKLAGPLPVAERPAEHDLDYRTHFERRMRPARRGGVSVGIREAVGRKKRGGERAEGRHGDAERSTGVRKCEVVITNFALRTLVLPHSRTSASALSPLRSPRPPSALSHSCKTPSQGR